MSRPVTHLVTPIYEPRKGVLIESGPGYNVTQVDLSPRREGEAVGWRPACGAPRRRRLRRTSDGISCKRCRKTELYRRLERRAPTEPDPQDWQARWDKAARSLSPEEYEKWVEGFIDEPGCPADLVERIRATEPGGGR